MFTALYYCVTQCHQSLLKLIRHDVSIQHFTVHDLRDQYWDVILSVEYTRSRIPLLELMLQLLFISIGSCAIRIQRDPQSR